MEGSEQITTASSPSRKAKWVKDAMERLDMLVDEETRVKVMENCSCNPSRYRIEKAKAIYKQAKSIDEFLEALQHARIVGAKLIREGNVIYVFYDKCYCGRVNATKEKISLTYCYCSQGYTKRMFEGIFEKPVKVELIQSVINGDEFCKFTVHL